MSVAGFADEDWGEPETPAPPVWTVTRLSLAGALGAVYPLVDDMASLGELADVILAQLPKGTPTGSVT